MLHQFPTDEHLDYFQLLLVEATKQGGDVCMPFCTSVSLSVGQILRDRSTGVKAVCACNTDG